MRALIAASVVLAGVALAGCDGCPYSADAIRGEASVAAFLGPANATRAEQALDAMGFDATRNGLTVSGQQDPLRVFVSLDGNGTRVSMSYELGHRRFRTYEAAQVFVDTHRAEAGARINATLADFLGRMGWTAASTSPVESGISVC